MSKRDNTALVEHLGVERRRPEAGGTPVPADAAALLGGILVSKDEVLHGDPMLEEELARKAVVRLRQHFNRHGCTRVKPEDPPCRHRDHFKDVALLRGTLMKLGLPGDAGLLAPRDDAPRRYERRSVAGMTVRQVVRLVREERIPAGARFDAIDGLAGETPVTVSEPVLAWQAEGNDDG